MDTDGRGGDRRAWLLLCLGLLPIFGALIGSAVLWKSEEARLERLTLQRDGLEITYRSSTLVHELRSAVFVTERAALSEADPALTAEARARLGRARETNEWASEVIIATGGDIATEIGIDPSTFVDLLVEVFQLTGASLAAQQPGQPLSPDLAAANAAVVGSIEGRTFRSGVSADEEVRFIEEVLLALTTYQTFVTATQEALSDLVLDGGPVDASSGAPAPGGVTLSDVVGETVGERERRQTWQTLAISYSLLDDATPYRLVDLDREPILRAVEEASDPAEAAAALQDVADMVQRDADLLYADASERLDGSVRDVDRRRIAVFVAGAVSALLAGALLVVTLSEIQHRRAVELAHRAALRRLDEKAQTDPLTGIWNRRRLEERLDRLLIDGSVPVILAYLDLDRFKAVNDVYGHAVGDEILKLVARRLGEVRFRGMEAEVVRFGGDEFVCYLAAPGVGIAEAVEFGDALIEATRPSFALAGRTHLVSATAGVAVSDHADTTDSLLLRADTSLVRGKQRQRGTTVGDELGSESGEMVKALPIALERRQIGCHFQPVFSLETGRVAHVEALARWDWPGHGLVGPGVFVPLIEAFGLSWQLTEAVLEDIADGVIGGSIPLGPRIWINASPNEFEAYDFADRFLAAVDRFELRDRIGLEITETAAVRNPHHFTEQVAAIGRGGVPVAIDDFGNGYSPLGLLDRLEVDVVKLDRSLVDGIDHSPGHQSLVRGVIGMLQLEGQRIVAEGVERPEELRWLAGAGVDLVQGFLLARPGPVGEVPWQAEVPANAIR